MTREERDQMAMRIAVKYLFAYEDIRPFVDISQDEERICALLDSMFNDLSIVRRALFR